MTFPIPENEEQRLEALHRYAVLDSPPEEVFDRITRLVSAYLDVPIALVSLVDEGRQWFKSKVGLEANETKREVAFCAHTILHAQLMIIPDASKDERFSASPLVVGQPNIAFYAGAPITTSDGFNLGTLCAIDRVPRELSLQQQEVLTDLANMVMDALEMRFINASITDTSAVQLHKIKGINQELDLLGQVFHKLDYSILFFDKEGIVLSMNNATSEIFGYSAEEIYGKHISTLFPKAYSKFFEELFNHQVINNTLKINNIPPQVKGLRKDGSSFSLEVNINEIKIDKGTAFRAQFRDTTKSDLADKAVEQFKFPLDISHSFIFMFTEESLFFDYVSQGAIKFTGYTQDELHKMSLFDLDINLSKQKLQVMIQPMLNGEKSELSYETRLKIKSGLTIPVQIACKIDGDNIIGNRLVIVGTDITERKKDNQAILDNQARLHAIVDTAVDGIITISEKGLIESSNRAAEELFGYSHEELKGQNVKKLMPESYAREHDGYLHNYKQTGEAKIIGIGREVTGKRKDGSEFPMELSVGQVKLGDAKLYTGIVRDITERKKAEVALLQARDEAERANRAKSDFLSRMSHELRTPLNAIVGFCEIMKMESITPIQQEYTDHILKAGNHLSSLINEVLEIARIEAGQQNLSIEPVHVRDLIKETWGLMSPMATEREIEFSYSDDGTDLYAMADLQRLKQVLLNLFSNAVKYNYKYGGINVTTVTYEDVIRISIQDTGPGIAKENFHLVFEVFERINADNGKEEGSGVGLALSKALVNAMAGELGLESTLGQGSTFWIELPIGETMSNKLLNSNNDLASFNSALNVNNRVYQLLYIEDNLSNMRLVEALIARRPDLSLTPAMQGKIGLELAFKHTPDLILLDIHLPDIQGDEVLIKLRDNPTTSAIPVIILSADATNSQIEKLLKLGANAYITKPLDIRRFIATVDEILHKING